MGVSGSGKSLIGKKLSKSTDLPFYDADDFHPQANIEKMKKGTPLNDDDRRPWLESLADHMKDWDSNGGAILGCSALKKSYRDLLRNRSKVPVRTIYLKGSKSLIAQRLKQRKGHFFDSSLLDSQFEALEEPQRALTIEINQEPDEIVGQILALMSPSG